VFSALVLFLSSNIAVDDQPHRPLARWRDVGIAWISGDCRQDMLLAADYR